MSKLSHTCVSIFLATITLLSAVSSVVYTSEVSATYKDLSEGAVINSTFSIF